MRYGRVEGEESGITFVFLADKRMTCETVLRNVSHALFDGEIENDTVTDRRVVGNDRLAAISGVASIL